MTEADWLACEDLRALLDFYAAKASQRKLRLFAAACCRRVWPLLTDRWSREAVETAEGFADGAADKHDFAVARETAEEALRWAKQRAADPAAQELAVTAARAAYAATFELPEEAARFAAHAAAGAAGGEDVSALHCRLFRDVIGNPFRPVELDPSWLHWKDRGVQRLARAIYEERRFQDLPALGGALAEAGCTFAAVLAHCREPGEHVRGCWVLDMLLGKK
jgi:hypothetical protein